ncbi:ABC transporter family substrate-binding protein, partial [Dietzia sp. B44]|nr:ABC transporter family substrate-binding protein [Dietzia sp. B44]
MATRGASVRRRGTSVLAAVLSLVVVTGCVADPPPPTVVGEERTDGESVNLSSGGVLLALDRVDPGFNPHLLADQGVDTDLVASLLLPSAFVPGPGGEPVLNRDLLVSAEPLPGSPRTIRYTIDPLAQWTDGVPVAAEDFEYLWRQMTTQPGVVDPAGYEQIVEVRSGAGGKVVDVVFDSPPTQWRTLFADLLPGHILKNAPDGFQGAMSSLPVMSAGPFMIRFADIGRGEIEFVRNDRYWARAPELDQILVRRATGAGQLGAALRGGPGSLAMVSATPLAADVSATVHGVRAVTVDSSAQLELGFNTVAPAVRDPEVRRGLTAAVDPEVVGRIVTGQSDPAVTTYPFPPGSASTTTGDGAAVERALR